MSRPVLLLLLFATALILFAQGRGLLTERILGTRIDLLPSLLVHAAWRGGFAVGTAFAAIAGLLLDTLSATPLGTSLVTLVLASLPLHATRELVARERPRVQALAGGCVAAIFHSLSLALLVLLGREPNAGWITVAHLGVLVALNALLSPILFRVFDRLEFHLTYKEIPEEAVREEVEIKRGT